MDIVNITLSRLATVKIVKFIFIQGQPGCFGELESWWPERSLTPTGVVPSIIYSHWRADGDGEITYKTLTQ